MASKYGALLQHVEIFENLNDAELEKVGDLVRERRFRANQPLFEQGDAGDALYIVAEGRLKAFIRDGHNEKVLAFYSEGQVLGEMSLLTGEPRSASATAETDARVLAIRKEDFDAYLASNVNTMREMMRVIAMRQAQTNIRLTRERDEEPESPDIPAMVGKVFTVFSPRGGSGKTMIAVNLAVSLAQMHPDQVALIDLALTWGHAPLMLNLVPKASLAGISADAVVNLDREALKYYLVDHTSTLRLLPGSTKPEEGESVTGDHVKAVLNLLKRFCSFIVVDTGGTFNEATITAMESSDRVIMVCTPELSTIRDIRECQRIFRDFLRIPRERTFFVMNQIFPFKPLGIDQFQQTLEQEMHAELPYAGDVPTKAAIRGEPFTQAQPSQAIAKAIDRMAKSLESDTSPLARQVERRGLFGR